MPRLFFLSPASRGDWLKLTTGTGSFSHCNPQLIRHVTLSPSSTPTQALPEVGVPEHQRGCRPGHCQLRRTRSRQRTRAQMQLDGLLGSKRHDDHEQPGKTWSLPQRPEAKMPISLGCCSVYNMRGMAAKFLTFKVFFYVFDFVTDVWKIIGRKATWMNKQWTFEWLNFLVDVVHWSCGKWQFWKRTC